ncbi:hypothetical protein ACIRP0_22640 [Streptomyces sp. NPDC101733]|uniref:hypothetical protein n=1 Tax=unclassified Streptomyces TaxID=2593676 RepID=UPI00382FB3E3
MGERPVQGDRGTGEGSGPGSAIVTSEHTRALLDASGPKRVLILARGQVDVVDEDLLRTEEYAGALKVASTDDLAAMAALSSPDKADVDVLASLLQAAVDDLAA